MVWSFVWNPCELQSLGMGLGLQHHLRLCFVHHHNEGEVLKLPVKEELDFPSLLSSPCELLLSLTLERVLPKTARELLQLGLKMALLLLTLFTNELQFG